MPLTARALQAMYEQNTDEAPIMLVSIDSGDTPGVPPFPLRFASNGEDIISNGDTYTAGVFGFVPPDQDATKEKRLKIVVPGPPQAFVVELRQAVQPPELEMSLVLASEPDSVLNVWRAQLTKVQADSSSFIAEMLFDRLTTKPFPGPRYTPGNFPGLF